MTIHIDVLPSIMNEQEARQKLWDLGFTPSYVETILKALKIVQVTTEDDSVPRFELEDELTHHLNRGQFQGNARNVSEVVVSRLLDLYDVTYKESE